MNLDNISNLDNRVSLRLREFALFCGTLNIEREDAQRGNCRVLAIARQALNIIEVHHIYFDLRIALLLGMLSDAVFATLLNLDPTHSHYLIVDHEAQRVWQVRFVSDRLKGTLLCTSWVCNVAVLEHRTQLVHILRHARVNFKECGLILLIVHHRGLVFNEFDGFDWSCGVF